MIKACSTPLLMFGILGGIAVAFWWMHLMSDKSEEGWTVPPIPQKSKNQTLDLMDLDGFRWISVPDCSECVGSMHYFGEIRQGCVYEEEKDRQICATEVARGSRAPIEIVECTPECELYSRPPTTTTTTTTTSITKRYRSCNWSYIYRLSFQPTLQQLKLIDAWASVWTVVPIKIPV